LGVIDLEEFKNPYAAPRKSTRDLESPPVEIDANFQTNLFGNVNTLFNSIFHEDSESGLRIRIRRETGREVVNFKNVVNSNGMDC